MALKIGNNAVANAFVGSSQVRRAYKGGTLVYQGFGPASEQEFIQQEATGGPAQLLKVYGKTIVNNQLVQNGDFANGTNNWAIQRGTISVSNGKATVVFNEAGSRLQQLAFYWVVGHKYYVSAIVTPDKDYRCAFQSDYGWVTYTQDVAANERKRVRGFLTPTSSGTYNMIQLYAYRKGSTEFPITVVIENVVAIDLTLLYGEGHEPTTVAQFEADYPEYDPAYDPGSLQSNKTAELRAYDGGTLRGSLSLNLSTLTGKLNGEGASVVVYPDGMRGVGTDRDAAYGSTGEVARAVVDLGSLAWTYVANKQVFTADSPNDSAEVVESYGISALCAKYSKTKADTLWGGQSPDKSFVMNGGFWTSGKRIGIKDTAYTDAATFKTAMSGVMLDYPLATPLTYTLDTPLPTDLTCEQGDILQRVSDNNCPFVGEMKFGL